ncbi:type II toxin-antitoxin system VapC family toxin [Neotabrizicola shimadae]|uniref:Type II toxin-antitoxin system VapC family toxin n=1 Tax=Neotabrizicola shimadae TaxID=2807096 RepID=A0A8G1EBM5_9RHOB|nr:type II toxin-antitoxin system VapC family toxin [Neotabrizicola shimadae]
MIYVLGANALSAVRWADRAPKVAAWLQGKLEAALFLSVITLGAIERGIRAEDRQNPAFAADMRAWADRTVRLFSDRLLPFGAEEARVWGRLSQEIGHGGADLMIAASALVRGATLVTDKVDDFRPTGVTIENPF